MAESNTGGGIGGIIEGFAGGHGYTPQYYDYSRGLLKRSADVGKDVLDNLRRSLPGFFSGFERGTEQQRGFQGEQENVQRNLLGRNLAYDPQQFLKQTGDTLFGFTNPNILAPYAQSLAKQLSLHNRAIGRNPAARDSTSQRLGTENAMARAYLENARNIYGILPGVYGQARQQGLDAEQLAAGRIPSIMRGYRELDYAPLAPLQASIDLSRSAIGIPQDFGGASKGNIWGFEPNRTWANNWGDAGRAAWNTAKDAASIYSSLYGGGMFGGMGGMGGGAGAGAAAGAVSPGPAYGSSYWGAGGNPYMSMPTSTPGGGMSYPIFGY